MTIDLVIKNSRMVLPDGNIFEGGVGVEAGRIIKVGSNDALPSNADKIIDANKNFLIPGVIDVHVHFREPGANSKEDWNSGSKAAVSGGITTVLDMPNNQLPITNNELLEQKREIAKENSLVNFGFHFGASSENLNVVENLENIASVKFYLSSTTGSLLIDSGAVLFEYFKILKEKKILATIHAESERMVQYYERKVKDERRNDVFAHADSRPNICAAKAMNEVIFFSKFLRKKVHFCHVSTKEEIALLRKGYRNISAEVTPHHLFLNRDDLKTLGNLGKVNPPLRTKEDQEELWKAIKEGIIKIVASDHAPHLKEEKELGVWGAPSGVPGVETLLSLLLNEISKKNLSLQEIVNLMSKNPAKIFRIRRKGKIKEGYDADLVIVDLKKELLVKNENLFTKCKWSPFNAWKLKGWPIKTFVHGNLIFDDGNIVEEKMKGKEVAYYSR